MQAQVYRMELAVRDLLSYASPKEPLLTWTEPKQLLERLIALVRPQAEAAGVQITRQQAEGLPKMRVDPELLTQALINLALNAIQAMEPGGVLRISLESADGQVRFAIADTGTGIAAEQIDRIYRPFYTTKHQGTGLGLAITRGIVDRHGGHLEIESALGQGSTFTLVIPAMPEEAVVP
jgi:two-component system sensor histidine kinase HydH